MGDENVEVAKATYEAFGRGDVPAVLGAFSDDIEWHEAEGMPYGGVHHGPQEVAENVFARVVQDLDGFTVTPREYYPAGDRLVVICHYGGTGKVTGKELDLEVAHAWDFRDGKLARFRQFADATQFLEVVPEDVAVSA
jgi:ketosteroid isomerase-like protein